MYLYVSLSINLRIGETNYKKKKIRHSSFFTEYNRLQDMFSVHNSYKLFYDYHLNQ